MKTISEILILIDVKIAEHKREIDSTTEELKSIGRPSGANRNTDIQNATKRLILKDKVLFHRACSLALHDLKDAIK